MLRHALQALFPGPRAAVIEVLTRTTMPLTGRTVASLVEPRVSLRSVQLALRAFVELGLVDAQPAGRSLLYSLRRDHLVAGPIIALTDAYHLLMDEIRGAVGSWSEPPIALWIFGSQARDDATVKSDVDIFVIRHRLADQDTEDWDHTIGALLSLVESRTGGNVDVLEFDEDGVRRIVQRGDALVDELLRDADRVIGPSPREVLKADRR